MIRVTTTRFRSMLLVPALALLSRLLVLQTTFAAAPDAPVGAEFFAGTRLLANAEAGEPHAQYELAAALADLPEPFGDRKAAIDWARRSALAGYAPAFTLLREISPGDAFALLAPEISAANADAKFAFLRHVCDPSSLLRKSVGGTTQEEMWWQLWEDLAREGDPRAPEIAIVTAARRGEAGALFEVYRQLEMRGFSAYSSLGILLERAAAAGHAPAQAVLATLNPDRTAALRTIKELQAADEPWAHYVYCTFFAHGDVRDDDARQRETIALLTRAADRGHVESMLSLATRLRLNDDRAAADRWLNEALATGDPKAKEAFLRTADGLVERRDPVLEDRWWRYWEELARIGYRYVLPDTLRRSLKTGEPGSHVWMFEVLESYGFPKNIAQEFLRRGVERGDGGAMALLAVRRRDEDPAWARELIERAVAGGDREAHFLYASYFLDHSASEAEAQKANEHLVRAAEAGHLRAARDVAHFRRAQDDLVGALRTLGRCLLADESAGYNRFRVLCPRGFDPAAATAEQLESWYFDYLRIEYPTRNAEANAAMELAMRRIQGRGLPRDLPRGEQWARRALAAHELSAATVLGDLYASGELAAPGETAHQAAFRHYLEGMARGSGRAGGAAAELALSLDTTTLAAALDNAGVNKLVAWLNEPTPPAFEDGPSLPVRKKLRGLLILKHGALFGLKDRPHLNCRLAASYFDEAPQDPPTLAEIGEAFFWQASTNGPGKDDARAFALAWLRRAAAQQNVRAAVLLGLLQYDRSLLPLIRRATELAEPQLRGYAGLLLIEHGGSADWQTGLALVKQTAAAGVPGFRRRYARELLGFGRTPAEPAHYEEGLREATLALEEGDPLAGTVRGRALLEGRGAAADPTGALAALKTAGKAGDLEAMKLLSDVYLGRTLPDRYDPELADLWLKRRIRAGDRTARVDRAYLIAQWEQQAANDYYYAAAAVVIADNPLRLTPQQLAIRKRATELLGYETLPYLFPQPKEDLIANYERFSSSPALGPYTQAVMTFKHQERLAKKQQEEMVRLAQQPRPDPYATPAASNQPRNAPYDFNAGLQWRQQFEIKTNIQRYEERRREVTDYVIQRISGQYALPPSR